MSCHFWKMWKYFEYLGQDLGLSPPPLIHSNMALYHRGHFVLSFFWVNCFYWNGNPLTEIFHVEASETKVSNKQVMQYFCHITHIAQCVSSVLIYFIKFRSLIHITLFFWTIRWCQCTLGLLCVWKNAQLWFKDKEDRLFFPSSIRYVLRLTYNYV